MMFSSLRLTDWLISCSLVQWRNSTFHSSTGTRWARPTNTAELQLKHVTRLISAPSLITLFPWCSLQLENLGNFIKAILAYGLKPNDIFEANDLFENGNMTQVQTTLLALASMVSARTAQRTSASFFCYRTQSAISLTSVCYLTG